MKQQTGSKLRKENIKAVYCHPADLTCMQSTSCEMLGWMSYKLASCLENHQQPHICIWHMHSNSTNWKGTKEPLDKGERGEWKSRLKTQHQKTKIMASGPITSWEIDGGKVETVTDFIFLCSKITADGDCSHEIKKCLLLGRKAMTNLDSILKSRDISLGTKLCIVKAMVFPVVMYRYESWTVKKAEHQRIDPFELWCWRRLLRVPWTVRRSNQSILKEINPEYWLEGLMLKLKLQYFCRLMLRSDSLKKTLILGKIEGRRRRGWQKMRWLDSIPDLMDLSLSKPCELVMDREAWLLQTMGLQRVGHDLLTEQQQQSIYSFNFGSFSKWFTHLERTIMGNFAGGPVIKNLPANAFDPWSGKISHAEGQLSPVPQLLSKHMCCHYWGPLPRAYAPQEKPPKWGALALKLERSSCSLQLEKAC